MANKGKHSMSLRISGKNLDVGEALLGQGRYAEALPLMDEEVLIHESHHNPISTWYGLNTRGQIKQSMGQHAARSCPAGRFSVRRSRIRPVAKIGRR